jgi:hypothetical protein
MVEVHRRMDLEDIAHVYHGISGARTAAPQRVSGD